MRNIYLEAIRKLPESYIEEKTDLTWFGNMVLVSNPSLLPMAYNGTEWENIELNNETT